MDFGSNGGFILLYDSRKRVSKGPLKTLCLRPLCLVITFIVIPVVKISVVNTKVIS